MHEMIRRALASSFERDRVTAASAARTRRSLEPAKEQAEPTMSGQVVIRLAGPQDARALARLGRLDADLATAERLGRLVEAPWDGAVLVAEVEGDVVAALVPQDGTLIADPFRPTADAAELL